MKRTYMHFIGLIICLIVMFAGAANIAGLLDAGEKQGRSTYTLEDYATDLVSKDLFSLPLELEDNPEPLPTTRVEHEGQLDLEDIQPGMIVTIIYSHLPDSSTILIVTAPYEVDGNCVFDAVYWNKGVDGIFLDQRYCSSYGLVPFENGLWSPSNYIMPTGQSISEMYMNEVLKDIPLDPTYRLPWTSIFSG
jgi:hypothetical protein